MRKSENNSEQMLLDDAVKGNRPAAKKREVKRENEPAQEKKAKRSARAEKSDSGANFASISQTICAKPTESDKKGDVRGGAVCNVAVPEREEIFKSAPLLPLRAEDRRQTVIVCFGTTAISGDSLGPLVGTRLTQKYNIPAFVYGTEGHCVNGKNMDKWIPFIKESHRDALFIAVDASLGSKDRIGDIIVREDGVCPAAIKGKKDRFGDVGILAVVAENKGDALMQLMSVSPLYVDELADKVAELVVSAV